MAIQRSASANAALQALLVTFLWSTSWVLIKFGLKDIPALTFAGLRYTLAFICLLPFALTRERRAMLHTLNRRQWGELVGLGVLYYAVTQGAQFIGLDYLPAVSVSLLLNFTTIMVAILGIPLLNERPGLLQWTGVGLSALGALVYFYPVSFPASEWFGIGVVVVGVITNALSSVLGRHVNRNGSLPPVLVTTISMGIGGILMLITGGMVQGMPALGLEQVGIIAWLAVVNTAFAFTLWNHTLKILSAVESSIINSTMLVQIALLAWIFLGEGLSAKGIIGLILAGLGALIVQIRKSSN